MSSLHISIRYASTASPQSYRILSYKLIDYCRAFEILFHDGSLCHGSRRRSAYLHGCPGFNSLPTTRFVPQPRCDPFLSSDQTAPDRFQWGSVMSRFITGWSLVILLLLNIGQYQEMFVSVDLEMKRAGIFLCLSA
jgi:hypothetical protein